MELVKVLLKNRLLVLLGTALLIAAGVVAWTRLPIDAFPDVTNTQVMILTKAPGLAAVDVEQRVSYPIEQVMRGLPRVKQVRSLSKAGLSQVVIIFEDGVDTYWTRQVVFERLAWPRAASSGRRARAGADPHRARGDLPVHPRGRRARARWSCATIQDWIVAPLLKPIPGVNEVNSFGG